MDVQGNVFVVGDPDQAIYRWRGADSAKMSHSFLADFPGLLGFHLPLERQTCICRVEAAQLYSELWQRQQIRTHSANGQVSAQDEIAKASSPTGKQLQLTIDACFVAGAQCYSLRDNYRSTPQVLAAALAVLPTPEPLQPLRDAGVPVQVGWTSNNTYVDMQVGQNLGRA